MEQSVRFADEMMSVGDGSVATAVHGRRPSISKRASSSSRSDFLDLETRNWETSSPEISSRFEQQKAEHERQRIQQHRAFEEQMKALQAQQAAEAAELMRASSSSSSSEEDVSRIVAPASKGNKAVGLASAPATPPRPSSSLSSEDDGEHDSEAIYQRMSQSVSVLSGGVPHTTTAKTDSINRQSKVARSKSGTDLVGMDGQFSPALPSAVKGRTAPSSPVMPMTGTGSNGHIGSGARRSANVSLVSPGTIGVASEKISKSMPASRRQSDGTNTPLTAAGPVSGNTNLVESMGQLNINGSRRPMPGSASEAPLLTSFLFDDEIDAELNNPAMFGGRYLAMNTDDDKFPILVRRDSFPGILSASSAALDLAPLSQTPPRSSAFKTQEAQGRGSEWPPFGSHSTTATPATSHPATLTTGFAIDSAQTSPGLGSAINTAAPVSPSHSRQLPPPTVPSGRSSPITEMNSPGKRTAGLIGALGGAPPSTPGSPEDFRGSKRASLGIPPSSNGPFAADLASAFSSGGYYANGSASSGSQAAAVDPHQFASEFGQLGSGYGQASQGFSPQKSFGLRSLGPAGPVPGVVSQKRLDDGNRFAGLRLEDFQGDMANLCKDQHGCRFLQRKLEEGSPLYRDMIFAEVYPHFAELMVDSFGNYLAQRLLEFSTDEQKDILLESIHDDLIQISLNIHGTRAIQRLIDHLTTQRHIQILISALNLHVVALIKDLNGNHVIQKCLNSLKPEDNQFIYNSVAANCVEVATHRHGCCVLQRCIDHASESQRIQLVTEITYNCLTLVQDPFSNYVVQYCLEFDRRFVEAIIRQFQGNVCALSCHKFSSNVIEKCIRVSDPDGRRILVGEMIERGRLERLVKDNFANYVIQTACDYAEPAQREELVRQIRPLLPMIRNTPYGKRIAARIQRVPSAGNRFVSYPMSGGFAYGVPPLAYATHGQPPLLDAFQHRPYGGGSGIMDASFLPPPAPYPGSANYAGPGPSASYTPFL